MVSCDINEQDVDYARALNAKVPNLEYRVEDALNLSFEDNTFDLVISVEVIERVVNLPNGWSRKSNAC
ncbi:MAG: class I SAM-dependent methyltransferase [Lewinellaceae bacterium]|nr:class I SAM-dependent methyltransferase [Lewinellaceae bacterium]